MNNLKNIYSTITIFFLKRWLADWLNVCILKPSQIEVCFTGIISKLSNLKFYLFYFTSIFNSFKIFWFFLLKSYLFEARGVGGNATIVRIFFSFDLIWFDRTWDGKKKRNPSSKAALPIVRRCCVIDVKSTQKNWAKNQPLLLETFKEKFLRNFLHRDIRWMFCSIGVYVSDFFYQ